MVHSQKCVQEREAEMSYIKVHPNSASIPQDWRSLFSYIWEVRRTEALYAEQAGEDLLSPGPSITTTVRDIGQRELIERAPFGWPARYDNLTQSNHISPGPANSGSSGERRLTASPIAQLPIRAGRDRPSSIDFDVIYPCTKLGFARRNQYRKCHQDASQHLTLLHG